MVRHHVKKKKKGGGGDAKSKKEAEEKKRLEEELGNLDRFAGSSDEEEADSDGGSDGPGSDGEDADPAGPVEEGGRSASEGGESADSDDDYADVYAEKMKAKEDGGTKPNKKAAAERRDDIEDEEEQNDSDDDYNDEMMPDAKSLGMANAMSRILGGGMFQPLSDAKPASQAKPVVLSKTTTPLQRLQQKLKTEEQALRKKRQSRRAENLSAMRLPLAPTAGMSAKRLKEGKRKKKRKRDNDKEEGQQSEEANPEASQEAAAVAKEIEAERTHRRIATRGVVALFNAISKHRAAAAAEATAREEERRQRAQEGYKKQRVGEEGVKTKHGFLDLIKKSAASGTAGGKEAVEDGGLSGSNVAAAKKEQGGWNALKDDFMMNSKLKDWDKEISDDDEEEMGGNDYEDASASG